MTLSDDGNHMSGIGEGSSITHGDLDMVKAGSGQVLSSPAGPPSNADRQGASAPGAPITMGQIGGLLVMLAFPLLIVVFALFILHDERLADPGCQISWQCILRRHQGLLVYEND